MARKGKSSGYGRGVPDLLKKSHAHYHARDYSRAREKEITRRDTHEDMWKEVHEGGDETSSNPATEEVITIPDTHVSTQQ